MRLSLPEGYVWGVGDFGDVGWSRRSATIALLLLLGPCSDQIRKQTQRSALDFTRRRIVEVSRAVNKGLQMYEMSPESAGKRFS